MKKLLFVLLAASMLLALTACGGSSSETVESLPFDEITVIDNDQITIRITGIDVDTDPGVSIGDVDSGVCYTLHTYIENKSSDTDYMIDTEHALTASEDPETVAGSDTHITVNGQDWDDNGGSSAMGCMVEAGKNSEGDESADLMLYVYGLDKDADLSANDIDFEITFFVYANSADGSSTSPIAQETVTVCPYGQD